MKIGNPLGKAIRFFGIGLLAVGSLSATVTQCPTSTDLGTLISTLTSVDNACYSQDKLFYDFTYTPGPNAPAASDVPVSLIFNAIPGVVDIHGWNFTGVWAQGIPGLANFTLAFTIEVCPATEPMCSGNVIPGTVITGADAAYAPAAAFEPGNETVNWSNGGATTLTSSSAGFLPSGADIGLGAGITGPLTVTADFSGTGAITGTTLRFYESVPTSEVPEPSTLVLVFAGLGLIGVGRHRSTKRKS